MAETPGSKTQVPKNQLPEQLQKMMAKPNGKSFLQAMLTPPPPPNPLELSPLPKLDDSTKLALVERTNDYLRRMRDFRRPFDAKRAQFYRHFISDRDQTKFPDNLTNRSNTFVPYGYSNVRAVVSRVDDAFFSFMPWFECTGRTWNDEPAAEPMSIVLSEKLEESNFHEAFEALVTNIAIYGHGAIMVDWDWDFDTINYMEPIMALDANGKPLANPLNGQPIIEGYRPATKNVPRNRPKFEAIDVYDLLLDPDGNVKGRSFEKTFGQLQREAEMNPTLYLPESLQEIATRIGGQPDANNIIVRMAELYDETTGTLTIVTYPDDTEVYTWKDLRYSIRVGASTRAFKRQVYGGPSILMWHGPIPYMHKKASILHTSYVKLPNEIYGMGVIESTFALNEALNRQVNMLADNWNLGINRRYAYDVGADIDHEALNNCNTPGGKVPVTGDPSKVILPLPFFTPQQGDYAIIDLYRGMIEMASGIGDFYAKGIGSPTNNGTATGINAIIQESNQPLKLFIRNLELDILQPLLKMCSSMIQQFVTDQQEVLITSDQPGIPKFYQVQPEELIGSFNFKLVAANYATSKVMRQRNLLAVANLISQSPFIDEYEATLELLKVFEVRNAKKLLKTPEQVQAEHQQAQQEQMQMMIFQTMLETKAAEELAVVQGRVKGAIEASKPKPVSASGHKTPGGAAGRPRKVQLEGKIPGGGLTSFVRELGQSMGGNTLGLEGMGEVPKGT